MKPLEILRTAWEGLTANKLRALLTTLGVIIGVAAVIIMVAISAGTEATISEQISSLGTNLLLIGPNFSAGGVQVVRGANGPGGAGLTYDDVTAIAERINGLSGVTTERNSTATVKASSVTLDEVTLIGTTTDYPTVRGLTIGEGRFLEDNDLERTTKVVVLGYSLAEDLFGTESPLGQNIMVGNVRLTVVGVMAKKGVVGNTDYDARLYMPLTLMFKKFTPSQLARIAGDRVNTIFAQVSDLDQMDKVIQQIKLLLAERHDQAVDSLTFSVSTQQDLIDTRAATSATFRSLLAWVASVSLIVGGIGIMNIMLVSVTERTREIGLRQSLGATPNDIRWQFLTEALALSLSGGLLGLLGGIGGAWLFNQFGSIRTVILPDSIALAFGSAAAVGIFFGFYPANKAAQLDPIEALRRD